MDKNLKKNVCNNIKRIMKQKGLNQVLLAKKLSVTQSNVSQLLSGSFNPSLETLDNVASALSVTIQELFQDNTFPFTSDNDSYIVIKCSELKKAFMEWDREVRSNSL